MFSELGAGLTAKITVYKHIVFIYNDFNIKVVGGLIIMTAQILLILVLVATIIPVCLLFGIPASKYNKKVANNGVSFEDGLIILQNIRTYRNLRG